MRMMMEYRLVGIQEWKVARDHKEIAVKSGSRISLKNIKIS